MSQTATIKSLPRAFRIMKAMQADGVEWSEDDRGAAGVAGCSPASSTVGVPPDATAPPLNAARAEAYVAGAPRAAEMSDLAYVRI